MLEGVDRAGKTTQCRKLVETLQLSARPAHMMRFPDRTTPMGQLINSYLEHKSDLEDHAVHLLFSANRWELVPLMKRKLEEGTTLIIDRYAFSGVAFSSAKQDLCVDWCMNPDVGLPKPDLVLFLQINPAAAAQRGQFGAERYETSSFQQCVEQNFKQLMADTSVNWQVVDASQSIDEVHDDIKRLSVAAMDAAEDQPIGALWKKR